LHAVLGKRAEREYGQVWLRSLYDLRTAIREEFQGWPSESYRTMRRQYELAFVHRGAIRRSVIQTLKRLR
jgi:hypothetical protein